MTANVGDSLGFTLTLRSSGNSGLFEFEGVDSDWRESLECVRADVGSLVNELSKALHDAHLGYLKLDSLLQVREEGGVLAPKNENIWFMVLASIRQGTSCDVYRAAVHSYQKLAPVDSAKRSLAELRIAEANGCGLSDGEEPSTSGTLAELGFPPTTPPNWRHRLEALGQYPLTDTSFN